MVLSRDTHEHFIQCIHTSNTVTMYSSEVCRQVYIFHSPSSRVVIDLAALNGPILVAVAAAILTVYL